MPQPRGRDKREQTKTGDVIDKVLCEEVGYREGGRIGRASRRELIIRKWFSGAIRGDVRSAEALLKLCVHAETHRDAGPLIVRLINDPDEGGEYDDRDSTGNRDLAEAGPVGRKAKELAGPMETQLRSTATTVTRMALSQRRRFECTLWEAPPDGGAGGSTKGRWTWTFYRRISDDAN